jgi:uncharacterized phiE125 gp8 family phage protein
MHLSLATAPVELPLSLAEAKAHLRVLTSNQDGLITGLISAASAHLDGRSGILGRALVTQTWDVRFDRFSGCGAMELPMPPLQSVTHVKYLDDAGVETTLDPSQYVVETGHMVGRIRPAYGLTWPFARCESGAVRIRFVADHGDAGAVPQPIKQAMLLLVGHWWINREAVGDAQGPHAFAVDALTMPYRIWAP